MWKLIGIIRSLGVLMEKELRVMKKLSSELSRSLSAHPIGPTKSRGYVI